MNGGLLPTYPLTDLFRIGVRYVENKISPTDAARSGRGDANETPDGLLVFMRRSWRYENLLDALFFRLSA